MSDLEKRSEQSLKDIYHESYDPNQKLVSSKNTDYSKSSVTFTSLDIINLTAVTTRRTVAFGFPRETGGDNPLDYGEIGIWHYWERRLWAEKAEF